MLFCNVILKYKFNLKLQHLLLKLLLKLVLRRRKRSDCVVSSETLGMYFGWLHKKTTENWSFKVLKKVVMVGFGFSHILRLLETTEFFFYLGLFERLLSAWTYVFWLITQENYRKLQYQSPQKKFLWSVSGSRIFFDYSKRPNFSFF